MSRLHHQAVARIAVVAFGPAAPIGPFKQRNFIALAFIRFGWLGGDDEGHSGTFGRSVRRCPEEATPSDLAQEALRQSARDESNEAPTDLEPSHPANAPTSAPRRAHRRAALSQKKCSAHRWERASRTGSTGHGGREVSVRAFPSCKLVQKLWARDHSAGSR
jgi:hypothetical protein